MDYMSRLAKMGQEGRVEQVRLEGAQTEGRILFVEPKPKPKGKTVMQGFQYADEVKLKDQLEDMQIENDRRSGKLEQVEDLTSIGTLPNFADFESEKFTQVYEHYSFDTRSDKRLLIHEFRQGILDQIYANQVTIIKGVTGCGKTTQVPQFILDDHKEQGHHCNIVVTQPRRIAAVSVANRVCQERGWRLGTIVGYQIGLDRVVSEDTRLNYVTTGVLLQMLIKKQALTDYTHIIIDEVHERDSETDFLLIVIKKFLKQQNCRTKVILMSATMNVEPFVDYFSRHIRGVRSEPPVVELSKVTKYSVQFYYLDSLLETIPAMVPDVRIENPYIEKEAYTLARHLIEIFAGIDGKEHEEQFRGSVLVFLPGIAEIENMYEVLVRQPAKSGEKWWICPLHSSITHEEQQQVFRPPPLGHRKVILTTNIAESSITVIDVKYVIDFCLTKHQVIDTETGYSSLQLAWISKSQGTQRAGRVGRVMPGRVYRFLSKEYYQMLPDQCPPEITRCALDVLVLKAKQLNVGPPEEILGLAIDPPDLTNIHKTVLYLKEMGALLLTVRGKYYENDGDLTYIGHIMAALPLDTKLSRLIILGHVFSLLQESIIMACAMSLKSIFSTPFKLQLEAYNSKLSWADCSSSDPIAYLNAYTLWKHKTKLGFFKRSGGQTELEWCSSMFIQKNVIKEVSRLESEVHLRLKNIGIELPVGDSRVQWDEVEKPLILKLILAGAFYPNYFVPLGVDEQEAVKTLSGRNPFNTVYLSGMPANQPGNLYVHAIKNIFKHCGAEVKIFYDLSSKTYISFGSFSTGNVSENDSKTKNLVPGKINLPVYRAVKMRQLGIPIVVPVLTPENAQKRANSIFGDRLKPSLFTMSRTMRKKSSLPTIGTNTLSVQITHINDPSSFWVSIKDDALQKRVFWIYSSLNNDKADFPPFPNPQNNIGQLCIAPFAEDGKLYRAQILGVTDVNSVRVFFVDYGNEGVVGSRYLRSFPDFLQDLKEEPPLAIKAYLAEIGPAEDRNAKGQWPSDAIKAFKHYFRNNIAIARIYSAVNNEMALILFDTLALRGLRGEFPFDKSFNHALIEKGLAELADEPYLSREDHVKRMTAETSPESISSLAPADNFLTNCFEPAFEDFEPINPSECRSRVLLNGPKSPLECTLYSLPKKCQGKEICIEWNSVNSVLLDTYPMDSHTRLIVAASVTSNGNNKLTLRNTTMMPNIHGLADLICLLFAPRIEPRADPERRSLIGALCGLGFDPETGVSFYPENDMEVTFDTQITHDDLVTINRIRYWMDSMLGSGEDLESQTRPVIVTAQCKIKDYILSLLHRRRPTKVPVNFKNVYEWDQLNDDELLDHNVKGKSIFPYIYGIVLSGEGKVDTTLLTQTELLEKYAVGEEQLRGGTQCGLCHVYLKSIPELKIHLSAQQHKLKLWELRKSAESAD